MSEADEKSEVAHEVWQLMSNLVLDNQRRRDVTEAVGMSFGRARLIRRVAARPMSMSDLASMLGIERSNATTLVNDLEDQGLVIRKSDPDDRRTRLVVATREGKKIADRANQILRTPPEALNELSLRDLETLQRLLSDADPSTD